MNRPMIEPAQSVACRKSGGHVAVVAVSEANSQLNRFMGKKLLPGGFKY